MYNAMHDTAQFRFEGIATPQGQSSEPSQLSDALLQRVLLAHSFLPHDPTTAVARLRELRAGLQGNERAYVEWLLERSQAMARRRWLTEVSSRERQFRARELRDSRVEIDALRQR